MSYWWPAWLCCCCDIPTGRVEEEHVEEEEGRWESKDYLVRDIKRFIKTASVQGIPTTFVSRAEPSNGQPAHDPAATCSNAMFLIDKSLRAFRILLTEHAEEKSYVVPFDICQRTPEKLSASFAPYGLRIPLKEPPIQEVGDPDPLLKLELCLAFGSEEEREAFWAAFQVLHVMSQRHS